MLESASNLKISYAIKDVINVIALLIAKTFRFWLKKSYESAQYRNKNMGEYTCYSCILRKLFAEWDKA